MWGDGSVDARCNRKAYGNLGRSISCLCSWYFTMMSKVMEAPQKVLRQSYDLSQTRRPFSVSSVTTAEYLLPTTTVALHESQTYDSEHDALCSIDALKLTRETILGRTKKQRQDGMSAAPLKQRNSSVLTSNCCHPQE